MRKKTEKKGVFGCDSSVRKNKILKRGKNIKREEKYRIGRNKIN